MYLLKALFGKRNSTADELLLKVLRSGQYDLQTITDKLSSGASVHCYTRYRSISDIGQEGYTPLHWACSSHFSLDEIEVVKLLLSRGADVNLKSKYGHTPLHLAAIKTASNPDKIDVLVHAGANVNAMNSSGETPLHNATDFAHFKAAKRLIEAGADVNAHGRRKGTCHGYTPLHRAVSVHGDHDERLKTIDLLLAKGANPETKTDPRPSGETALDRAKGILAMTCARGDATDEEIARRKEIICKITVL